MKRYRVIATEFDTRVLTLQPPAVGAPEPQRSMQQQSYGRTLALLKAEYGEFGFEAKLANLQRLSAKPMSVVDFHNQCLDQCRQAFVFGQYYPALASAYLLAERMLAHLTNGLHARYQGHHDSSLLQAWEQGRNWQSALELLLDKQVITSSAADLWRVLYASMQGRLHADDVNVLHKSDLAFEAINQVEAIIKQQFAGHGNLPWLFAVNDEYYIRKEFEQHPFIQLIYLPASVHLGYQHQVRRIFPWEFHDVEDYPEQDLSDDEFMRLREHFCSKPQLNTLNVTMSA